MRLRDIRRARRTAAGGTLGLLVILLPLLCAACSNAATTQARSAPQAGNTLAGANNGPEYATDAQRARAQNYWLPRNQLGPNARVEDPTPGGALARG